VIDDHTAQNVYRTAVIPAKAGIQDFKMNWAPAFAGVTSFDVVWLLVGLKS